MDEKSVLISLGDARLKQISEVMASKTCNKILEYLSEKDATVSDISRELKIPLNTADYNVKKLMEAGLIEKVSHFWSVKGKKMPTYRVSNKKIIISPKKSKSLTSLLLALGITGIIAAFLRRITEKEIPVVASEGARSFADAGMLQMDVAVKTAEVASSGFFSSLAPWEWFIFGAWFAILLFFALTIIDERRKSK
jgi:DNA-binding transcriptional ArsR family regulator